MISAKRTSKIFQQVEFALLVKDVRIHFDTTVSRKYPRTSTGRFLGMSGMGSRIRSQEEFGASTGSRSHESLAVHFGFQNREAIQMGTNTANQQVF